MNIKEANNLHYTKKELELLYWQAKARDIKKKELNTEQALQLAEEINELWEEAEKRWSIIIFHQELDSIKISIIAVKSSLESGDIEYSYQQIENSIFLVGHIREKWTLKLKNIF